MPTSFGSVVETILGAGIGALVGARLAEALWRTGRIRLAQRLQTAADRLRDDGDLAVQPRGPKLPMSTISVFADDDLTTVVREPSPIPLSHRNADQGRRALPSGSQPSPTIEVTSGNRAAGSYTINTSLGAVSVGGSATDDVLIEGLAPDQLLIQPSGDELVVIAMETAGNPMLEGVALNGQPRSFAVGQRLDVGPVSIRRTS